MKIQRKMISERVSKKVYAKLLEDIVRYYREWNTLSVSEGEAKTPKVM